MEESVFRQAKVRETFESFVVLEVFTDEEDKALARRNKDLERRLAGYVAMPVYVVIDPRDEKPVVPPWGWSQEILADPSPFSDLLLKALEAFKRRAP